MASIVVTGGTGTLGRPTVQRLRSAGHDVRVLSRRPGEDTAVADLTSGRGSPPRSTGRGSSSTSRPRWVPGT